MAEIQTLESLELLVETELSLLEAQLDSMEGQIALESRKAKYRRPKELPKPTPNQDIEEWIWPYIGPAFAADIICSRIYRGPFLITLFTVYELTVEEIARFTQMTKGIALSLNQYRRGTFLDRAKRHYKKDLKLDLSTSSQRWERLKHLLVLRNSFTHWSGRINLMDSRKKQQVQKVAEREDGIILGIDYIDISDQFLRETFDLVKSELLELIERLRARNASGIHESRGDASGGVAILPTVQRLGARLLARIGLR